MEEETKSVTPLEDTPQAEEKVVQDKVSSEEGSNESFLGTILIVVLILLLLGVMSFFGFIGYRVWHEKQKVKATPSIDRLAVEEPAPTEDSAPLPETPSSPTAAQSESVTPPPPTIDKALLEVKVLNGGATKGSAGTLTETLKKAGFTKAAYGNTTGDYVGTVIYYSEGKEAEAEVLKTDVMKTYPAVTITKALPSNKDTFATALVVILGR